MRIPLALAATLGSVSVAIAAVPPVEVRVRQTPAGPRLFVDGKAVRPRFYYGSPPCLCNIAWSWESQFNMPFKATEDTTTGLVELSLYDGEKPIDFYDADLIDLTSGTTNFIGGRVRTDRYVCGGLKLHRGHVYRFRVKNRADHDRTYFRHLAAFVRPGGERVELPLPYGDTLGDEVALAADAGVKLVTFSTDSSWGCDDWWNEAEDEAGFARIDALCERLIAVNPNVLLVPRVIGNAPDWFLKKHPESRMVFDRGYRAAMVSVSCRPYRKALCTMVEKLVHHLQRRFPRNFAGLHVGGQNSAEWFYFNSQSGDLSGYDVATRDAFRAYLAAQGDADAASAEVPSPEERRRIRPGNVFDPAADRRMVDFVKFRQIEIASLLRDIGEAIRRGADGKCLALFFYGYTWELASNGAGGGETGHYGMEWLQREGKHAVDGFSGPISYQDRNLTGSASVMSAAESCLRRGFLWINEDDTRTCREEFWDNHSRQFTPHSDIWTTKQILLRDSISCILRGYGDWWMDLFGRGWHRDAEMWKIRKALNGVDDRFLARKHPYESEIAVVTDDASLVLNAAGSNEFMTYLRRRTGYVRCGGTYGQYFFDDLMLAPPESVKLVYLVSCNLKGACAEKLRAFKAEHPNVLVVEATTNNVTAEAVADYARKAGVHLYTEPNRASIEAAEGYLMVQARQTGPLTVDFGVTGAIRDVLAGNVVGMGPKLTLEMREGEVRLFQISRRCN